jgi:predicted transcriptional regulator of viral defense system
VPDLMRRLDVPYYAGLLTAAQYHGAAHQRPQEFQVFVEKPRRPLVCGLVRVTFIVRKEVRKVPTQSVNTLRGSLLVSTPEATAIDLMGYHDRAGGLNQAATVLAELAERLDPKKLPGAAKTAPLPWAQRLGYVLEQVGASDKTEPLKAFVQQRARALVPLLPRNKRGDTRSPEWKLIINAEVETDL